MFLFHSKALLLNGCDAELMDQVFVISRIRPLGSWMLVPARGHAGREGCGMAEAWAWQGVCLPGAAPGGGRLGAWAQSSGFRRAEGTGRGGLRFAFYGRVSTEDWQDPVSSRARQPGQSGALVRGHGIIVAEFFDEGYSRTVAWGRRPQAAALIATLSDPGRGWDAIVIGEYERAFYRSRLGQAGGPPRPASR